jgi:hypothetical protein
MERFNLKKLNKVEAKERYRLEISNRFAALENLDTEVDINKAWETVRENVKISAKESLGSQNYWVFGLFPSSSIVENRKHDVSKAGSVSILR